MHGFEMIRVSISRLDTKRIGIGFVKMTRPVAIIGPQGYHVKVRQKLDLSLILDREVIQIDDRGGPASRLGYGVIIDLRASNAKGRDRNEVKRCRRR